MKHTLTILTILFFAGCSPHDTSNNGSETPGAEAESAPPKATPASKKTSKRDVCSKPCSTDRILDLTPFELEDFHDLLLAAKINWDNPQFSAAAKAGLAGMAVSWVLEQHFGFKEDEISQESLLRLYDSYFLPGGGLKPTFRYQEVWDRLGQL